MLTIAAKKKHRGIKLNPVERVGMAVVYLICIMAGGCGHFLGLSK